MWATTLNSTGFSGVDLGLITIEYSFCCSTVFTQILSCFVFSFSDVVAMRLPLLVYRIVMFTIVDDLMSKDFKLVSQTMVAEVSVSVESDSAVIKKVTFGVFFGLSAC